MNSSELSTELVSKLGAKKFFLCTVESCTGGRIANAITDVSGSSDVFWGSFVVYHNSAKTLLGVRSSAIDEKGAVSPEVAQALAESGLEKMKIALSQIKDKNFICISTTGVAGPKGGTSKKPVGLCYIAAAANQMTTIVKEVRAPSHFTRNQNKEHFVEKSLELALSLLDRPSKLN